MPDLGYDIKDFKVFSWRLNNWKKLDEKLTSQEFECGGHKWSGPFSVFQLWFRSHERQPFQCQQANSTLPIRKRQHITEWCNVCIPWTCGTQDAGRMARMCPVCFGYLEPQWPHYLHSQPWVSILISSRWLVSKTNPFLQMQIIASSPRSVTGDLHGLPSCANYSTSRKVTCAPRLRMKLPIWQCMWGCWRILRVVCGIILSSASSRISYCPFIDALTATTPRKKLAFSDWKIKEQRVTWTLFSNPGSTYATSARKVCMDTRFPPSNGANLGCVSNPNGGWSTDWEYCPSTAARILSSANFRRTCWWVAFLFL